ncbi:MAG: hypothetical protein JWQ71_2753 [Pedosphaera sp.]|nr:hypothetical protein [Pedosphaera sp.]
MRIVLFLLCALLLVTGCATKTVNYPALQNAFAEHHSALYRDTTYYCGSKDDYDYFYIEYGMSDRFSQGQVYRVASSEIPLTNRFPFSKEKSNWKRTTLYESATGK